MVGHTSSLSTTRGGGEGRPGARVRWVCGLCVRASTAASQIVAVCGAVFVRYKLNGGDHGYFFVQF